MKDLNECRAQIDAIDAQLIDLFEARMRISRDVALYKHEHRMDILDVSREHAVLESRAAQVSDEVLSALGLWPEDGGFAAAELHIPAKKAGLEAAGLLPPGLETLTGSDAHALLSLREDFPLLGPDSVLWPLVEQLPAPE